MPCYHPVALPNRFQGSTWVAAGDVPCGQCIGCRLERSRQWAVRCIHEASLHEDNAFITLTYRPECLPENGSLDRAAFPLFMRRLRKRVGRVRYFHCGEYGDDFGRPHYHACLFGHGFNDRVPWAVRNGIPVWRSPLLEAVWPYGHAEVGSVTFESAAYVARYVVKKVTGRAAGEHYRGREPEYATMSRRPGIGRGWLEQFGEDVYPSDEVIVRGKACRPPRYYDQLLKAAAPEEAARVSDRRRSKCDPANETRGRLRVREVCAASKLSLLPRNLESGA